LLPLVAFLFFVGWLLMYFAENRIESQKDDPKKSAKTS
jgi:hypothetical protein